MKKIGHFFFVLFFSSWCCLQAIPTAYVTVSSDGTVVPVDLATDTVGAPIPVGIDPISIAITPDGTTAYVVMGLDINGVYPINIATNTAGPPIVFPDTTNRDGIAITPNGTAAYVVNVAGPSSNTVQVINIPANTLGVVIPVGSAPNSIAITPDGTLAFVTNTGDNTVTVIDIATNTTPFPPIALASNPMGIAITPNGQTAYVVINGNNTVVPINIATRTTGTAIAIGSANPEKIAINPAGTIAYVTAGDGTVTPISIPSNIAGTTISVDPGNGLQGVAFTSDGQLALVVDNSASTVVPITVATQFVGTAIPVGLNAFSAPVGIAITPVSAPTNFQGKQKNNRFAFESELFNVLTWSPSPSPGVVSYNLYRNGVLIANILASEPLKFKDHNRNKRVTDVYNVTAVFANGVQSFISSASVTVP